MNYTIMASDHGTKIEIRGDFTARYPEAFHHIMDAVALASRQVEIFLCGVTTLDEEAARTLLDAKQLGAKTGVPVYLRDNTDQVDQFVRAA